jgi:hypothetical protein
MAGHCTCTATGSAMCGAICAFVAQDPQRCGANCQACGAAQYCTGGNCQCRPGLAQASGGACSDCQTTCTSGFCMGASCVTACPSGTSQCNGVCADLGTDPLHCGSCDRACAANQMCVAGECRDYRTSNGCNSCPCTTCAGDFRQCCTYGANVVCLNGDRCP